MAYKMLDALRRELNKLFLGDAIQKIALLMVSLEREKRLV